MKQKSIINASDLNVQIVNNILKIMNVRGFTKSSLADSMNYDASKMGKILNLHQYLSMLDLENFAKFFTMRPIDLITYPEKYVRDMGDKGPMVSVTIEVTPENRQQLLNFIK